MPTMSSYELKVSGMLETGDNAKVALAISDFKTMMNYDASAWAQQFAQSQAIPNALKRAVTVDDAVWDFQKNSMLTKNSLVKAGSFLNDILQTADLTLTVDTLIIGVTTLQKGSIVGAGSIVVSEPYRQVVWDVRPEIVPKWTIVNGIAEPTGTYVRLTLNGFVVAARQGALGEQWGKQTAQDDLEWFYKYRTQLWFKTLIKTLIEYNDKWSKQAILAESLRVRDVKWYCGNGAGP